MNIQTKPAISSKGVQGSIVAVIGSALSLYQIADQGMSTGQFDIELISSSAAAAIGGLLALYGRYAAGGIRGILSTPTPPMVDTDEVLALKAELLAMKRRLDDVETESKREKDDVK